MPPGGLRAKHRERHQELPSGPIRRVGVGQALGSVQHRTWPIREAGGIIILHGVVRPVQGYVLVAEIHGQAVRCQGV